MATKKAVKKTMKQPEPEQGGRPQALVRLLVTADDKPAIMTSVGPGVVLNDNQDAIFVAAFTRDLLSALGIQVICDFPRPEMVKTEKKS